MSDELRSSSPDGARSSGTDWFLGNAEAQHQRAPRSFFIPSRQEREALSPGRDVRLSFFLREPAPGQPGAERMWLEVVGRSDDGAYVGRLKNQPVAIRDLAPGDLVRFGPEHVIAIDDPGWSPYEDKLAFASRRLIDDDSLEPRYVCHDPEDERRPARPDGSSASGWQLLVGDEDDDELNDARNVVVPSLAWLMERYPAFGDLVFAGERDGEWTLDETAGAYRRIDGDAAR